MSSVQLKSDECVERTIDRYLALARGRRGEDCRRERRERCQGRRFSARSRYRGGTKGSLGRKREEREERVTPESTKRPTSEALDLNGTRRVRSDGTRPTPNIHHSFRGGTMFRREKERNKLPRSECIVSRPNATPFTENFAIPSSLGAWLRRATPIRASSLLRRSLILCQ